MLTMRESPRSATAARPDHASRCGAAISPVGACSSRRWKQHELLVCSANAGRADRPALIAAPHYRMVGSRAAVAGSRALSASSTSTRAPATVRKRVENPSTDIFQDHAPIHGAVITYVLELRTDKLPQLYLWEPEAYKDKLNSFTLYYGIVIGIAGFARLFLTILFVVKWQHHGSRPPGARLGGARLHRTDFGSGKSDSNLSAGAERVWRASGEADFGGDPAVFLFAYLNSTAGRPLCALTAAG